MGDPSVTYGPDYRSNTTKLIAWAVLVISGGQVLVPLLVIIFCLNKSSKRHPTLLIYLLSWVLYSISACLLLYTQHSEAHPPYGLCLAQVALINASYMMIAFAAVSLMLQLRFTLPTVNAAPKPSRVRDVILVVIPPSAGVLYMVLFYGVHAVKPEAVAVERGRLTCRFIEGPERRFFAKFTPIVLGVLLLICFGVSIYLLYRTVQRVLSIQGWKLKEGLKPRWSDGVPWLRILTRFVVFGLYSVLTIAASLIDAITPQGPFHEFVDFYVATLPLAAASIFGTIPDLRKMWQQWKAGRRQSYESDMTMVNPELELEVYHIPARPRVAPVRVQLASDTDSLHSPMSRKPNEDFDHPSHSRIQRYKGASNDALDIA